jgi:hypothetical protein
MHPSRAQAPRDSRHTDRTLPRLSAGILKDSREPMTDDRDEASGFGLGDIVVEARGLTRPSLSNCTEDTISSSPRPGQRSSEAHRARSVKITQR